MENYIFDRISVSGFETRSWKRHRDDPITYICEIQIVNRFFRPETISLKKFIKNYKSKIFNVFSKEYSNCLWCFVIYLFYY